MSHPLHPPVTDFTITGRVKLADGNTVTFTITDDGASYIDSAYHVDATAARMLQDTIQAALKNHLVAHPLPLPGSTWRDQATSHPLDARTAPAGNQTPPASPAYPKHLGY